MSKKLLAASVAALAAMLSTGSALAASGYAIQAVNVRGGPGTDYGVVGKLSAGEEVEILGCEDGWCETDEGYVAASYLSLGGYDEDEDDDDGASAFDPEDGEFDDDPLGLEDDMPGSIRSGGDDD